MRYNRIFADDKNHHAVFVVVVAVVRPASIEHNIVTFFSCFLHLLSYAFNLIKKKRKNEWEVIIDYELLPLVRQRHVCLI